MEHIEIGNTGDLINDVDMRSETKCMKCGYNNDGGTICDLTKKWCYISRLSCLLISEVKMKDEFRGPQPGPYKVHKKNNKKYFMHKKSEQLLDYTQETLNLLKRVEKKKKKSEDKK